MSDTVDVTFRLPIGESTAYLEINCVAERDAELWSPVCINSLAFYWNKQGMELTAAPDYSEQVWLNILKYEEREALCVACDEEVDQEVYRRR